MSTPPKTPGFFDNLFGQKPAESEAKAPDTTISGADSPVPPRGTRNPSISDTVLGFLGIGTGDAPKTDVAPVAPPVAADQEAGQGVKPDPEVAGTTGSIPVQIQTETAADAGSVINASTAVPASVSAIIPEDAQAMAGATLPPVTVAGIVIPGPLPGAVTVAEQAAAAPLITAPSVSKDGVSAETRSPKKMTRDRAKSKGAAMFDKLLTRDDEDSEETLGGATAGLGGAAAGIGQKVSAPNSPRENFELTNRATPNSGDLTPAALALASATGVATVSAGVLGESSVMEQKLPSAATGAVLTGALPAEVAGLAGGLLGTAKPTSPKGVSFQDPMATNPATSGMASVIAPESSSPGPQDLATQSASAANATNATSAASATQEAQAAFVPIVGVDASGVPVQGASGLPPGAPLQSLANAFALGPNDPKDNKVGGVTGTAAAVGTAVGLSGAGAGLAAVRATGADSAVASETTPPKAHQKGLSLRGLLGLDKGDDEAKPEAQVAVPAAPPAVTAVPGMGAVGGKPDEAMSRTLADLEKAGAAAIEAGRSSNRLASLAATTPAPSAALGSTVPATQASSPAVSGVAGIQSKIDDAALASGTDAQGAANEAKHGLEAVVSDPRATTTAVSGQALQETHDKIDAVAAKAGEGARVSAVEANESVGQVAKPAAGNGTGAAGLVAAVPGKAADQAAGSIDQAQSATTSATAKPQTAATDASAQGQAAAHRAGKCCVIN